MFSFLPTSSPHPHAPPGSGPWVPTLTPHQVRTPYLFKAADGAALGSRSDVVSIATGHQHRVPGGESTRLTVSYTRLCHMGALAGALAVTSHRHVESWKEMRAAHEAVPASYLCFWSAALPLLPTHSPSRVTHGASGSLGWLPPGHACQ